MPILRARIPYFSQGAKNAIFRTEKFLIRLTSPSKLLKDVPAYRHSFLIWEKCNGTRVHNASTKTPYFLAISPRNNGRGENWKSLDLKRRHDTFMAFSIWGRIAVDFCLNNSWLSCGCALERIRKDDVGSAPVDGNNNAACIEYAIENFRFDLYVEKSCSCLPEARRGNFARNVCASVEGSYNAAFRLFLGI